MIREQHQYRRATWHWILKITLFCMTFFPIFSSYAGELSSVNIDAAQDVIYCDVSPKVDTKHLKSALNDGSTITFIWDILVEEKRDYWLNKSIGSVLLSRQVIPDLVSRQWLLKDDNSGITRTTLSADSAIDFLSQLKHFPVIDKSILEPNTPYRIKIELIIEEGNVNKAWWSELIQMSDTVAIGGFVLP